MADSVTDHGAPAPPQNETRLPKRGLMSGLKAIVKQVSNRWSRSPQIDPPPRAEQKSSAPPVLDQSPNTSKPQPETKQPQAVASSIELKYANEIPQAYVPHEQNQEWLREQLRQKMQPLDEALAARQEAAARERAKEVAALPNVKEVNKGREIKETRPSGEIIYKRAQSPSGRAAFHLGDSAPPQTRTPSVDAGVPPLPLPQTLSVRSIKAEAHEVRKVDIPPSKMSESPRLSRTPSSSTIRSTASSVFSTTSKSSVRTSASSIADAPPSLSSATDASHIAQAPSVRSINASEARKVDIPASKRPEDVRTRPSPNDLGRAEDHQKSSSRPPLNPRVRSDGRGL
jgi:hypothetical protein